METALEQAHKSPAWKELVKRNIFQDVYLGSAEFTKFLAQRIETVEGFYDAISPGKTNP